MPRVVASEIDRAARTSTPDEDERPSGITHREASGREPPIERLLPSTEYAAFITGIAAAPPISLADPMRDAAVQAKLDGVRDAFSGPYLAHGKRVTARPMFRMTTHEVPKENEAAVDALGARAGVRAPYATRVGQGAPRDLVKITQALIDDGRLPPGPGDLSARIRRMQWDYGIGVDCAGYSRHALAASAQRPPAMSPGESFRDLDGAHGSFAKVAIETARPGDLITLDPIPPEVWGHNVVVYSRATADDAKKSALGASSEEARAFLGSRGPHHVLEVDSSWGAGAHGSEQGGYRRDTWIYDGSTGSWGSFVPGAPHQFVSSARGPAGDAYHGTYRPR